MQSLLRFTAFIGIFLSLLPIAFGNDLQRARDALANEDYATVAEALLIYLEQFPDHVEFVDQIIASIAIDSGKQTNQLNRLAQNIENNPGNIAAIQSVTQAIADSSAVFDINLVDTIESALDVSYEAQSLQQLDMEMDRVMKAQQANKFVVAIDTLQQSISIGQDRFFEQISDAALQNQISALIADLTSSITQFKTEYRQTLNKLQIRYENDLLSSQQNLIINQTDMLVTAIDSMQALIRQPINNGQTITRLLNTDATVAYLKILDRIVNVDYYPNTAIPATFQNSLRYQIVQLDAHAKRALEIRNMNIDNALQRFAIPVAFSELALSTATLTSIMNIFHTYFEITDNQYSVGAFNAIKRIDTDSAISYLQYYSNLNNTLAIQSLVETFNNNLFGETAQVSQISDNSASLQQRNQAYQQILSAWRETSATITALNQEFATQAITQRIDATESNMQRFIAASNQEQEKIYNQYFQDVVAQYRPLAQEANQIIAMASVAIYGVSDSSQAATLTEIQSKYPDQALDMLNVILPTLNEAIDALLTISQLLETILQTIIISSADTFSVFLTEFVDIRTQLQSLQFQALTNVARAQELRSNGDQFRAQAEGALAQSDGRAASRLWRQAQSYYLDSLALQDDPQFREQIDTIAQNIQASILEIEHAQIVAEVRILINRSRRAVTVQDIDQAYNLIQQATELWQITNVTPNPEIERQRDQIELILRFEQIFQIIENDPLYAVVSGYLNVASINVPIIKTHIANGADAVAQQLIAETTQIVQSVIDIQPYNTEARSLNLRLLEVTNREEFDIALTDLFSSAIALADAEPQQSLSDFYTIQALRPSYPGLAQEIETLEIALGLRVPQIALNQKTQVAQIVAQAEQLIASGNTNRITAAISLLDDALVIDPSDTTAQRIQDAARIQIGSGAQITLSLNDEQLLRRAETLFVQGNVAQTFVIVENLWQTPINRNYPPLISLRKQVSLRLGI